MSRKRAGRRGTRSNNEYGGKISYYCTRGAGDAGREWPPPGGLTWLRGGGHVAVAVEPGSGPGTVRCPLCGLSKRIGHPARKRIADAGLTEVDISALPF